MRFYDVSLLFLSAVLCPAWQQGRFEVVSVRPALPEATVQDSRISFRGDRFEARAVTVGDILDMLNGYQLFRVTGGPSWMRSDRFDIMGKADRELDKNDRKAALMALLAERFHLESHQELRAVAAIVLRPSRALEGLKRSTSDESYSIRTNDSGDVVFTATPLSALTNYLSRMWHCPVIDETQTGGTRDFVLAISRIEQSAGLTWGDRVREAAEDVGFRIENRQISLDTVVVDRCERPAAN